MSLPGTVLVIGGAGRLGRLIAARAVEGGAAVRVLSRRPAGRITGLPDGVDVRQGDITGAGSVAAAMTGVEGVVVVVESADSDDLPNGARAVHHEGMRHVVAAAEPGTVVALISQIYITRPEAYPSVANTIRWRGAAEDDLRGSGLPYVVVRPSWLTDDLGGGGVRLDQGDRGEGQVARADVAEVTVAALGDEAARGTTFEVYGDATAPPATAEGLGAAFAVLSRDG